MQFPWVLVLVALAYGVGYGTRPLITRWKEHSPEWRMRSERYQRITALLPGYLLGFGIGVVLPLMFDH